MKNILKSIVALVALVAVIGTSSCGAAKGCGCPSNLNGAYKSAR